MSANPVSPVRTGLFARTASGSASSATNAHGVLATSATVTANGMIISAR